MPPPPLIAAERSTSHAVIGLTLDKWPGLQKGIKFVKFASILLPKYLAKNASTSPRGHFRRCL